MNSQIQFIEEQVIFRIIARLGDTEENVKLMAESLFSKEVAAHKTVNKILTLDLIPTEKAYYVGIEKVIWRAEFVYLVPTKPSGVD